MEQPKTKKSPLHPTHTHCTHSSFLTNKIPICHTRQCNPIPPHTYQQRPQDNEQHTRQTQITYVDKWVSNKETGHNLPNFFGNQQGYLMHKSHEDKHPCPPTPTWLFDTYSYTILKTLSTSRNYNRAHPPKRGSKGERAHIHVDARIPTFVFLFFYN